MGRSAVENQRENVIRREGVENRVAQICVSRTQGLDGSAAGRIGKGEQGLYGAAREIGIAVHFRLIGIVNEGVRGVVSNRRRDQGIVATEKRHGFRGAARSGAVEGQVQHHIADEGRGHRREIELQDGEVVAHVSILPGMVATMRGVRDDKAAVILRIAVDLDQRAVEAASIGRADG